MSAKTAAKPVLKRAFKCEQIVLSESIEYSHALNEPAIRKPRSAYIRLVNRFAREAEACPVEEVQIRLPVDFIPPEVFKVGEQVVITVEAVGP